MTVELPPGEEPQPETCSHTALPVAHLPRRTHLRLVFNAANLFLPRPCALHVLRWPRTSAAWSASRRGPTGALLPRCRGPRPCVSDALIADAQGIPTTTSEEFNAPTDLSRLRGARISADNLSRLAELDLSPAGSLTPGGGPASRCGSNRRRRHRGGYVCPGDASPGRRRRPLYADDHRLRIESLADLAGSACQGPVGPGFLLDALPGALVYPTATRRL